MFTAPFKSQRNEKDISHGGSEADRLFSAKLFLAAIPLPVASVAFPADKKDLLREAVDDDLAVQRSGRIKEVDLIAGGRGPALHIAAGLVVENDPHRELPLKAGGKAVLRLQRG